MWDPAVFSKHGGTFSHPCSNFLSLLWGAITQWGSHSGVHTLHPHHLFLGALWGGSSLACTFSWWGASQQQFCRVYLRMGYPKPTCVIKNHRVFAQSQCWWISSEAQGLLVMLRRGAAFGASYPVSWSTGAGCSPILVFLRKNIREKKKKQTRTMQKESTSTRTVCSL